MQFLLALFIAFFFWFYGAVLGTHLQVILRRIAGDQAERLIAVTGPRCAEPSMASSAPRWSRAS